MCVITSKCWCSFLCSHLFFPAVKLRSVSSDAVCQKLASLDVSSVSWRRGLWKVWTWGWEGGLLLQTAFDRVFMSGYLELWLEIRRLPFSSQSCFATVIICFISSYFAMFYVFIAVVGNRTVCYIEAVEAFQFWMYLCEKAFRFSCFIGSRCSMGDSCLCSIVL